MKKFFKKYRIVASMFLIGIIILLVIFFPKEKKEPQPSPSPTPTPFVLNYTFPSSGVHEIGDLGIAIYFAFSKPVDQSTAKLIVKPLTGFEIFTDDLEKTLFIKPTDQWKYNVEYQITLEIESKNGEKLDFPIEHSFKFTKMTFSPLSE